MVSLENSRTKILEALFAYWRGMSRGLMWESFDWRPFYLQRLFHGIGTSSICRCLSKRPADLGSISILLQIHFLDTLTFLVLKCVGQAKTIISMNTKGTKRLWRLSQLCLIWDQTQRILLKVWMNGWEDGVWPSMCTNNVQSTFPFLSQPFKYPSIPVQD